jgi:membrane protein
VIGKLASLLGAIRQRLSFGLHVLKDALHDAFFKDGCGTLAAAIAFWAVLSGLPLLIVVTSLFGTVLRSSAEAYDTVSSFLLRSFPASTGAVDGMLRDLMFRPRIITVLGAVALLWAGSAIFSCLEGAMNTVWKVPQGRHFVVSKLRAISLVPVAVLFMIGSILLSGLYTLSRNVTIPIIEERLADLPFLWTLLGVSLPLAMSVAMFFAIYRVLPNARVPVVPTLVGAVFAAVAWEASKHVFDWYMTNVSNISSFYGSLGVLIALVLWAYYSAFVMLLGVEVAANFRDRAELMDVQTLRRSMGV